MRSSSSGRRPVADPRPARQMLAALIASTLALAMPTGAALAFDFWAFEPNVGISYQKGGFDFSVRLLYDIVTENTDSNARGSVNGHYQSGNVFTGEFSVTQAFGSWRFGLTGYGVAQTNDDSANGQLLRATEASRVGLGLSSSRSR